MRSIVSIGTWQTSATWETVIPYFTRVRMRADFFAGISATVAGSEVADALTVSRRIGVGGKTGNTRGLCALIDCAGSGQAARRVPVSA
jgi:hypothetical protein